VGEEAVVAGKDAEEDVLAGSPLQMAVGYGDDGANADAEGVRGDELDVGAVVAAGVGEAEGDDAPSYASPEQGKGRVEVVPLLRP
jgi:hypothetical protein